MNVEIYQISKGQFEIMLGDVENKHSAMAAAEFATEILVGIYNGDALCFIGLCPRTIISEDAYIWMITTPAGETHPRILGRYSRGVIETILLKYSRIFGHCFSKASAGWLLWLGADFTSPTEFEIRRG